MKIDKRYVLLIFNLICKFLMYRISSNSFRGIQVLPAAATKRGRLLLSSVKGKIIEWVIVVKEIPISIDNRPHSSTIWE